ncbi:MAG: hypothetical protein HQL37_16315 [Alphaproteobacteria bacterium]|nr:hypothetical protein [Alphaproteobacteria bacterium]
MLFLRTIPLWLKVVLVNFAVSTMLTGSLMLIGIQTIQRFLFDQVEMTSVEIGTLLNASIAPMMLEHNLAAIDDFARSLYNERGLVFLEIRDGQPGALVQPDGRQRAGLDRDLTGGQAQG